MKQEKPQDITQMKGLISVKARLLENYVGGVVAKGDGEDKLSLADEDENQGLTIADYLKDQKCSQECHIGKQLLAKPNVEALLHGQS